MVVQEKVFYKKSIESFKVLLHAFTYNVTKFYKGGVSMLSLQKFLLVALFLLPVHALASTCGSDVPDLYNSEWKVCSEDAQCVLVKGACGFNAVVNTASAEDATCYFEKSSKKQPYCPSVVEKEIDRVYCDPDMNTCMIEYQK